MNDIYTVHLSKKAVRDLKKVPTHVSLKLYVWIDGVINDGLSEVRKIIGYHDGAVAIRI